LISQIELSSFKRFRDVQVRLEQLTILTGLNASGKSSLIQALQLVHQASRAQDSVVPLTESDGLQLGSFSDVLSFDSESVEVEIRLRGETLSKWVFGLPDNEGVDSNVLACQVAPKSPPWPLGSTNGAFTLLQADRIGPRISYQDRPRRPGDYSVGQLGQHTAHVLATSDRRVVPEGRRHAGTDSPRLIPHVERWLSSFVGETQLNAAIVPRTGVATLLVRGGDFTDEWMLPTNTGFGVTYCLPIVIAALLIEEGGLLIVDSPEAHLHPKAQSAIGAFLALVAASGVQVILETHSDHVLNGIRRYISKEEPSFSERCVVQFFDSRPHPEEISVFPSGSLSSWPEGFFDQFETDLEAIHRADAGT